MSHQNPNVRPAIGTDDIKDDYEYRDVQQEGPAIDGQVKKVHNVSGDCCRSMLTADCIIRSGSRRQN